MSSWKAWALLLALAALASAHRATSAEIAQQSTGGQALLAQGVPEGWEAKPVQGEGQAEGEAQGEGSAKGGSGEDETWEAGAVQGKGQVEEDAQGEALGSVEGGARGETEGKALAGEEGAVGEGAVGEGERRQSTGYEGSESSAEPSERLLGIATDSGSDSVIATNSEMDSGSDSVRGSIAEGDGGVFVQAAWETPQEGEEDASFSAKWLKTYSAFLVGQRRHMPKHRIKGTLRCSLM